MNSITVCYQFSQTVFLSNWILWLINTEILVISKLSHTSFVPVTDTGPLFAELFAL